MRQHCHHLKPDYILVSSTLLDQQHAFSTTHRPRQTNQSQSQTQTHHISCFSLSRINPQRMLHSTPYLLKMSTTMSSSSTPASLPTLTIEIFDLILTHITAPRDLASLCLVSQALYSRVIPKLYYRFSYHGIKHSKESLRAFFMAVLWNAELAGCVRVLDLGEYVFLVSMLIFFSWGGAGGGG